MTIFKRPLALIFAVFVIILVLLAGLTAFARHEVFAQTRALRDKGVIIDVHELGWRGVLFDIAIPKHQFAVQDVRMKWRLAKLFPLRIGFAWTEHLKHMSYDVHDFENVQISVVGFAQPTSAAETVHLDVAVNAQIDGENFALGLDNAGLRFETAQDWTLVSKLVAIWGKKKVLFEHLQASATASGHTLAATETGSCLTLESIELQSCTLNAEVDEALKGKLHLVSTKAAKNSQIARIDAAVDFDGGDNKSLHALFKGKANKGAIYDLQSNLKIDLAVNAENGAYQAAVACAKPCVDLHLSKEVNIPLGKVKFDANYLPNLGRGSRYNLEIDAVDAGFYEDLVQGLMGVKYIVKTSGKALRDGVVKGDLLIRESNRNYDLVSDYTYDLKSKLFSATPKLRLSFSPMFAPKSVYDPLEETLKNVIGAISLEGNFRMRGSQVLAMPMQLKFFDVYGEYDGFPFAKLHLDSKWNWDIPHGTLSTLGPQSLSIEKFGKELALEKASIVFDIQKGKNLAISDVKGSFCDGTISVTPIVWNFKKPDVKTELRLDKMNLGKVLTGLQLSSLSGDGTVEGVLPIVYQNSQLTIKGARFNNIGEGLIRYKDPSAAGIPEKIKTLGDFNGLLAKGQQALAFKALDNFHYQTFVLEGNRSPVDGMDLKLSLKGDNPDIAGGQKFELSIPITGDVESLLVQTLIQSMMEESGWEEKIQDYMKKHDKK